jgi:hypothetical protein
MKAIRSLAEARTRLENAVAALPGDPADSAQLYERYEQVAIQILDSEHDWYPPGLLQELLMSYLYIRQIELGLIQDPDVREQ